MACEHLRTTRTSVAAPGAIPGTPTPGTITETCDDCGKVLFQDKK